MTLYTREIAATYQGQPARLSVIRREGEAWGRLTLDDGTALDVLLATDVYDLPDDEALACVAGALASGAAQVEPSMDVAHA